MKKKEPKTSTEDEEGWKTKQKKGKKKKNDDMEVDGIEVTKWGVARQA